MGLKNNVALYCLMILTLGGGVVSLASPSSAPIVNLFFFGGIFLLSFLLIITHKKNQTIVPEKPMQDEHTDVLGTVAEHRVFNFINDVHGSVLGIEYRRKELKNIEKVVDSILDTAIRLISSHIEAHTVAVLFPTHDNGYKIRRYFSRSDCVNKDTVIYPGVGIIGGFLKDGLKQLNLHEIVTDSMTLYYYKRDAGIRSLMATPIVIEDVERAAIIVDSTEKKHFTDEHHAYLSSMAELLGHAVYYAYLYNEHKIDHVRLAAMSNTEKHFFQKMSILDILDKMVELVPFAIRCDRLCICIREDKSDKMKIERVWGENSEELLGKVFSLKERSLASIVASKNISITRNFSHEKYEVRFFNDENHYTDYQSFFAFPLGVDSCHGIIFLESKMRDAFPESSQDLLSRLSTSAGLAIQRIQIFQKSESLATHDGLTGLYNHRQFQILLKEAITRSIRYKDPVSLVICDIDHFKKVNDTYGHRFGDTVLKTVSAKLQSSIRDGVDIAARYGGEEFALVLEKTDARDAKETVERIRTLIGGHPFQSPMGKEMKVTMSFGIAVYGVHARNQELLIQRADKALYAAKEGGRNRSELYYDPAKPSGD